MQDIKLWLLVVSILTITVCFLVGKLKQDFYNSLSLKEMLSPVGKTAHFDKDFVLPLSFPTTAIKVVTLISVLLMFVQLTLLFYSGLLPFYSFWTILSLGMVWFCLAVFYALGRDLHKTRDKKIARESLVFRASLVSLAEGIIVSYGSIVALLHNLL